MRRKFMVLGTALALSSSILFSSCIGSFNLFNKLLAWNQSVGDKWVNELVFLACCIVPVYPIAGLIDVLILNSIEFWTGENPSADVQTKEIETENGSFIINTDATGHKIQKVGSDEVIEFRFDAENNAWNLVAMEEVTPLFQFVDEDQAKVFLADGSTMTVGLNEAGMLAFRQVVENKTYFAKR